jgi:hypothetical protein
MQRRYQRRTAAHYGTSGHSMFGGTGWLFADLLLALALAFLLATTVGSTPPKTTPKAHPTVPATHKPPPVSHPKQVPTLELDPVHIAFTIADPAGLAEGSSSAVAAVRATIQQEIRGIKNRSAGIVLLFGGNGAEYPNYSQLDQGVENVLKSLSGPGQLFHPGTRYRPFLNLGDPSQFNMDVYLFSVTG